MLPDPSVPQTGFSHVGRLPGMLQRCHLRIYPAPDALRQALRGSPQLCLYASPPRQGVTVSSCPSLQLPVAAVAPLCTTFPVVAGGAAGLPPPLPPLPQPSLVVPRGSVCSRPLSVFGFMWLIFSQVSVVLGVAVQNEREVGRRRGSVGHLWVFPVGVLMWSSSRS